MNTMSANCSTIKTIKMTKQLHQKHKNGKIKQQPIISSYVDPRKDTISEIPWLNNTWYSMRTISSP